MIERVILKFRGNSDIKTWWSYVGVSVLLRVASYAILIAVSLLVFRLFSAVLGGQDSFFVTVVSDAVGVPRVMVKADVFCAGIALVVTLCFLAHLLEQQALKLRLFCDGGKRGWI